MNPAIPAAKIGADQDGAPLCLAHLLSLFSDQPNELWVEEISSRISAGDKCRSGSNGADLIDIILSWSEKRRAGREKAGKTMDGFDVVPTVPPLPASAKHPSLVEVGATPVLLSHVSVPAPPEGPFRPPTPTWNVGLLAIETLFVLA